MIVDQHGVPLHEARRRGLARAGKLRTGSRDTERGFPRNMPTFRIEPEEQGKLNTFLLPWHGSIKKCQEKSKPEEWKVREPIYKRLNAAAMKATESLQRALPDEYTGDVPELRVWLPREDPLRFISYSYKLQMGGRKWCQCDGHKAMRYDKGSGSWGPMECKQEDGRLACEELTNNKCRMRMNIGLRLPWLGWYETAEGVRRNGTHGVWQLDTGSWAVLGSIFEEIEEIRDLYGRITRVPVRLFKAAEPTSYKDKDGKQRTGKAFIVHLGPWGDTLETAVESVGNLPVARAVSQVAVFHATEDAEDVEEELTRGGVAQAGEKPAVTVPAVEPDPEDALGAGETQPQALGDEDAPPEADGEWTM